MGKTPGEKVCFVQCLDIALSNIWLCRESVYMTGIGVGSAFIWWWSHTRRFISHCLSVAITAGQSSSSWIHVSTALDLHALIISWPTPAVITDHIHLSVHRSVSHMWISLKLREIEIGLWLVLNMDRKSKFLIWNLPSDSQPKVQLCHLLCFTSKVGQLLFHPIWHNELIFDGRGIGNFLQMLEILKTVRLISAKFRGYLYIYIRHFVCMCLPVCLCTINSGTGRAIVSKFLG